MATYYSVLINSKKKKKKKEPSPSFQYSHESPFLPFPKSSLIIPLSLKKLYHLTL